MTAMTPAEVERAMGPVRAILDEARVRPEGQPGTVWAGHERTEPTFDKDGHGVETVKLGLSYPAVLDLRHNLWIWRDGGWIESPGYGRFFTPGEEWEADCTHEGLVPWKGCDTEADCRSLRREDARREAAER